MISSPEDSLYVNNITRAEKDIDELYSIASIKEIVYDKEDKAFYILFNKLEEKLGFYILKIDEEQPTKGKFLIRWKNKLDIGDPNIFVLRNYEKGLKELVVSYKVIYLNVYNVISMDISAEDEKLMIFRHESF